MVQEDMKYRLPEVIVFAGPNGSGKSTITDAVDLNGYMYINADEIKKALHCDDLFAAETAEKQRNECIDSCKIFPLRLSCLLIGI